jgi:hypothetical protein
MGASLEYCQDNPGAVRAVSCVPVEPISRSNDPCLFGHHDLYVWSLLFAQYQSDSPGPEKNRNNWNA